MTKPALTTWKELKKFALKYGAKIYDSEPGLECIYFGHLEFDQEGIISCDGEIICPVRTYGQMKAIIQMMFK